MTPQAKASVAGFEARSWACRPEPHLEQLLQDPLIRLMMASDGVVEADIRRLASAHRAPRSLSQSVQLSA